jgi:hypothetical protein
MRGHKNHRRHAKIEKEEIMSLTSEEKAQLRDLGRDVAFRILTLAVIVLIGYVCYQALLP